MIIDRAQVAAALPQYEIGQTLGRGAHGLVFSARHRMLGSMRAVKALVVADQEAPGASRRFLTEARVMTALDHPHIVRVHEYAEAGPLLLLVMELLGSGTLANRMRGPVAPEKAVAWSLAVADGLEAAHRRGVVHRDIKPANLLFTGEGIVKVGDFGIAKLFAGSDASASADLIGTPRYIAPEQITGERVGPATDVYALGITLYEMLAGRSPFPPQLTVPGLLHHHMSVAPAPLENVPPHLARAVLHTLAKNPAERPPSAVEFAHELVRAADRDLGPDWIVRSGVPLRVDSTLVKQARAAVGRTPVAYPPAPAYAAATAPPFTPVPPSSPTVTPGAAEVISAGSAQPGPPPQRKRGGVLAVLGIVLIATLTIASVVLAMHIFGRDKTAAPPRASASESGSAPVKTVAIPTKYTPLGSYAVADLEPEALAISRDGKQVASIDRSNGVRIWHQDTKKTVIPKDAAGAWSLVFDPRGQDLITGTTDGKVRKWATASGVPDGPAVTGQSSQVSALAVDDDGVELASGDDEGEVRLFNEGDSSAGTPLGKHSVQVSSLAMDPFGNRLASASDDGVQLWDTAGRKLLVKMPSKDPVVNLRFSPDGSVFAAGDTTGKVQLWDAGSGRAAAPSVDAGHSDVGFAFAFTGDSSKLVTVAANKLTWWDASTGRPVGRPMTVHTSAPVTSMALNADATRLALGTGDAKVTYFQLS